MIDHGIAWSDTPPSDKTLWVPILSPKAGETVQAVSLSSSVLGVQTHFFAERTVPCLNDRQQCSCCQHQLARRWKGFLAGWQTTVGRFVIIEMTRQCFERARITLSTITDLRGYLVCLSRSGKARNAAVVATLRSWCLPEAEKLPRAFDLKAALMRIWSREGTFPAEQQGSE